MPPPSSLPFTASSSAAAAAAAPSGESAAGAEAIVSNDCLDLDAFLHLMGKISMVTLTNKQIQVYETIFSFFDRDNNTALTSLQVQQLLFHMFHERIHPEQIRELLQEWEVSESGMLTYPEFLSLISYTLKQAELEHEMQKAVAYFSVPQKRGEKAAAAVTDKSKSGAAAAKSAINMTDVPEMISAKNVRAAIKKLTGKTISMSDAEEMIFIADNSDKGYITAEEFIQLVSIVYEPGFMLFWNFGTQRPHRIMHDLIVEGEFDAVDNGNDQQETALV
jgi:Ca2+-binding EF-hand superfamily protein